MKLIITDMGIQGLWQILEPVAEPVTLESLEGKRLAIDISIWLYQATYGYAEHQLNAKCPHLSLILRRLAKLLYYKIRPVFVFDGPNVPIFKKKLLRDRQVKRYVEELTMTKAQKHVLQQLASSQLRDEEQRIDELSEVFASQTKKRRDNDLFDVSMPSTSRDEIKCKNTSDEETSMINSSFESSRSSEFDQIEFENLTTRDERVDYLLVVRDKIRSLKMREVPDDSKAFSNLQLDRLLKRNQINGQLQLLKNEGLKRRVFSADGKQSCSNSSIKLATMEGLDRVHIITDDNEVQIIDEEKEAKKKNLMDLLTWPAFVEKIKRERDDGNVKNADNSDSLNPEVFPDNDDDDNDDALQEAIYASLLEDSVGKCSKSQIAMHNYIHESKGDMIERLRAAFTKRTQDTSDEFVEVLPEQSEPSERIDYRSSNTKTTKVSTQFEPEKCNISDEGYINEKNKNIDNSNDQSIIQGSTMRINSIDDKNIFPSTREEGVYKDCKDLLRICGIPFVIAPAEAEAQCCELERLGLVQGIISDDSDVWLFGAAVVYKNMFNQKRRLQMYSMETIRKQLGLSRWEAVQIALLSGGDYTNGLEGVGVVAALELISEFASASRQVDVEPSQQAFENLCRISAWLNHRDTWDDLSTNSDCISEQQNIEKKKFVKNTRRLKLRQLIEKNNVAETLEAFPSREIFNAYAQPLVDNSTEKPKWRKINIEELESFVWEKLGWDGKRLEQQTNHSLLKWNDYLNPTAGGSGQSYQTHITSFTHRLQKSEKDQRLFPTARVQAALQRLVIIKNSQNQPSLKSAENNCATECAAEVKKIKTNERLRRKRPNKCTVEKSLRSRKGSTIVPMNKRKKLTKTKNATNSFASGELQLSEESSNSDIC
uniref:Uncharacterized protein n=1 Tax=Onchocerca volvulus TaxID=6282 RepID=A0A8R1TQ87_ONCVO